MSEVTLETERLLLRMWREEDFEHYAKICADPEEFADFVKHCKTDAGYASLKSVLTKEKADSMHSFLFAETFKYFYLLFAPPDTVRLDVFFNTEAHPIRRTW